MQVQFHLIFLIIGLIFNSASGQDIKTLKNDIKKIIGDKKATVAVSVTGKKPADTISINGNQKMPMQSVYKFHLALAVLHQVDLGHHNLNDSIVITKEQLDNNLWSLIRKKYPNGAKLTLREIIKYTLANSDNIGCDLLFRLIGGPKAVKQYMHEVGITDISIKHNEQTMQSDWKLQYQNWTTAKSASKTLKLFFENVNQELSKESHSFLWETMKTSWFGKISMKSYLPVNTVIAHKTGHSGKNGKGITGAQNDIGIIFLPNGNYYYLSILISDSKEANEVNQKLIAGITKLTFNYFNK